MLTICHSPGEVLPPFPKSTHSGDPAKRQRLNLSPLSTINDTIRGLQEGDVHHNLHRVRLPQPLPPYDADAPLPRCITCSGGQNYHPSGLRKFTHREYACLQGFPRNYVFTAPRVLRQIGNAVPPSIGKVFLEEVKLSLMRADGLL